MVLPPHQHCFLQQKAEKSQINKLNATQHKIIEKVTKQLINIAISCGRAFSCSAFGGDQD